MEIENLENKLKFYSTLNERQRRHFAALEAEKLGHGGITLVSDCFKIHRETVSKAISEINTSESLVSTRLRASGAGRKKKR
ncbi:MAG: hypothetical protein AAF849_18545 [Bacteroidota bacterium]